VFEDPLTFVSSFGSTMMDDEDEDAFGDDTNYDVPLWGDGGTSAMQSNTLELNENQGFGRSFRLLKQYKRILVPSPSNEPRYLSQWLPVG
jgi:hypothetical protein